MIRIAIIFTTAVLISVVAAYFSIVGLAALFSATFWGVVIMGASLELGKVVAATWAHEHWSDPTVSRVHKGYLVAAVAALMLVTSLGIYGYLSKGHLEQAAPIAGTNLQIQQGELRIQQLQADNTRLTTRLDQLDQSVNVMLGQDRASQGLRARNQQRAERQEINTSMDANNAAIQKIQADLLPLKTANLEVEAKLGPVKYVAELFGWKDPEAAVRMIILLIMSAFDPLALVLIISCSISWKQYQEKKRLALLTSRDSEYEPMTIQEDHYTTLPLDTSVIEESKEDEDEKIYEDFVFGTDPNKGTHVTSLPEETSFDPEVKDMLVRFESKMQKPLFIPTGTLQESEEPDSGWDFIKSLEQEALLEAEEKQPVVETKVEIQSEDNIDSESEETNETPVLSEKEQLIMMLEKNPEILQDIIEVVDGFRKPENNSINLRKLDDQ